MNDVKNDLPEKTAGYIYESIDYAMFKIHEGNRPLSEAHVKKLALSISENNLLKSCPIIVSNDYVIIDGQHRLAAAQRLGTPIFYIKVKGLGLREIQRLNSNNKNWGLANYLEAYCILKNEEYIKFKDFLQSAGIPINTGLLLVYGSGDGDSSGKNQAFRDGNLKIGDLSELKGRLSMLFSFKPFYEGYLRRSFVLTVLRLRKKDFYDHSRMIAQLEKQPAMLVDCTGVESYLKLLEEIYNYNKSESEYVSFF